jgi:hypothetical protein
MPQARADINIDINIDINEPVEIDYWVERLGVSEQSLRQAVADVGVSAQEVAEHLGKR